MGILKPLAFVAASILLAASGGCSSWGGAAASSSVGPPLPVESWSQIDIPLSRYTLSSSDWSVVYSGVVAVQNRCLARFGLPSAARVPSTQPTWKEDTISRRYGVWNRAEVEKYGYDAAPTNEPAKPKSASPQDAAISEVMGGQRADGSPSTLKDSAGKPVGQGGCGKEGWDAVRAGGPLNVESVPSELADDSWSRLLTDGRFTALEAQWAGCMKHAGYELKHRWETADQVRDQAKQIMIRAAVMDLTCAEQVNFVGIANQIDSSIQVSLISGHEGDLRGALDAQTKLLENAKRVTKG